MTTVRLVDVEHTGITLDTDIKLPTLKARQYILNDDDAKECRIIHKDELFSTHVDNNILSIEPLQPDPWTLSPDFLDKQDLEITYSDGRTLSIRLGEISKERGHETFTYLKTQGISFPIDDSGRLLMNAANTPRLSNVRFTMHEVLRTRSKERLELVAIGAAFGMIIGKNGGIGSGEALDEVSEFIDNNSF